MLREKGFKRITAIDDLLLEEAVNKFFETSGMNWRVVSVTAGSGYRTAWLEYDPS